MPPTARALSKAMPHGQLRMLAGQNHNVNPGVLAPVMVDFVRSWADRQEWLPWQS